MALKDPFVVAKYHYRLCLLLEIADDFCWIEELGNGGSAKKCIISSLIDFIQVYILIPIMILNDTIKIRPGIATTES